MTGWSAGQFTDCNPGTERRVRRERNLLAGATSVCLTAFVAAAALLGLFSRVGDGTASRISGRLALLCGGATLALTAASSLLSREGRGEVPEGDALVSPGPSES
jgi:hypothetical protein